MKARNAGLLVIGLFVFLYILPLGMRPLFVPDETRYAEIPREMIAGGNWVVPRLDGLVYFEKPVLGYWLHALSLMAFGENNFAVRFPSALAAGCSALFVFLLGYREKDRFIAPLAALIFLTCFEVAGVGTFAVLDSLLTCFLTGCLFFFFQALTSIPDSRQEKMNLVLAGIFCGLAFLTKGFLAIVVPALTIFAFLIWQKRFLDLFRLSWLPLIATILIITPWALAIHLQEPEFWHYFFWEEHVHRFMGENAPHHEALWFYLVAAPAMFFPWILLAPAAVSGLKKQLRKIGENNSLIFFSLCWLLLPFAFFSLSSGKLLTYILPCFPPFALLMAMGLNSYLKNSSHRLLRWGTGGTLLLAVVLACVFLWAQLVGLNGFYPYVRQWKWMMVATSLTVMLVSLIIARQYQDRTMFCYFGLSPVLLLFVIQFAIPDFTLEIKSPEALLNRHLHDIQPETLVLSGEETVRAVCWYLKRDNVFLVHSGGELTYGNNLEKAGRVLTIEKSAKLIEQNKGKIVFVLRKKNFEKWRPVLPEPVFVDSNGQDGYVFLKF